MKITLRIKNDIVLQMGRANKSDAKQIIEYLNIVGGESDNLLFGFNGFHMSIETEENICLRFISKKAFQCFADIRSESIFDNAGLNLPAVSL